MWQGDDSSGWETFSEGEGEEEEAAATGPRGRRTKGGSAASGTRGWAHRILSKVVEALLHDGAAADAKCDRGAGDEW